MCGRFTMTTPGRVVNDLFQLPEAPLLPLRFNIAPTQPVASVRKTADQGKRELVALHWGLIPSWAKDRKIGYGMINARAETAATKPAFRSPFRNRRCLVAADGFYEWQKTGGKKQPYYFRLTDGQPFGFAGLWDRWESPDGELVESVTILTTEANELLRPLHERMPVILEPKEYDLWLDPSVRKPELVQPLLRPYRSEAMTAYPVSPWVNDARHDDPRC